MSKVKTSGVHRTDTPCGTSTGYSAATIDVTSLPMRIEQVLSPILCLCMAISKGGSDHLPYIQQRAIVKLKKWVKCYEIAGEKNNSHEVLSYNVL